MCRGWLCCGCGCAELDDILIYLFNKVLGVFVLNTT